MCIVLQKPFPLLMHQLLYILTINLRLCMYLKVSVSDYESTDPWSQFGNIVGFTPEKCATPTITYANGKIRFACETEDVEFVPTVTCAPSQLQNGNVLDIGGTFTVSVYATKEGHFNSDVATKTFTINKWATWMATES